MRLALAASLLVLLASSVPARADHGVSYRGHYFNAFAAGTSADGRPVAVMAGTHSDFPYHDAGSTYDQVAVYVGGAEPVVVTGRPKLDGLGVESGDGTLRVSYSSPRLAFDLELAAVRHTPRYEADPAQLGDLFLQQGVRSDRSPGFVYTPIELTVMRSGWLEVRGRRLALAAMHGQAEEGEVDAPADRRFRSAYDYLAAPTADPGAGRYTYLAFSTRALHADGAPFDAYFRETASDEFTMEDGRFAEGNPHGAPRPFTNTEALPDGAELLGQWAVDLGPGVLSRKLVRLADREGRALLALSETILEDRPEGPDSEPPRLSGVSARAGRLRFELSEPALVAVKAAGRWLEPRTPFEAGTAELRIPARLRPGRRALAVTAVDEAGNRAGPVRLRVAVRRQAPGR